MDEAPFSLFTGNPNRDDNLAATSPCSFEDFEVAPWNKLNLPDPEIKKFTLHSLQNLFTLFTDASLFTGVMERRVTKFVIVGDFAPFYASLRASNTSSTKPV